MAHKDKVLTWLNDAYAMEKQVEEMLESQLDDSKDFKEVEEKTKEHLELTKQHLQKVKECIEKLGGEVSDTKSALASLMGKTGGGAIGFLDDKVVRNGVLNHAVEHLEMASYQALIAGFEELDEDPGPLKEILKDEEEMAKWLEQNSSKIVKEYLKKHHQESEETD